MNLKKIRNEKSLSIRACLNWLMFPSVLLRTLNGLTAVR